jgi:hypothetical protein
MDGARLVARNAAVKAIEGAGGVRHVSVKPSVLLCPALDPGLSKDRPSFYTS